MTPAAICECCHRRRATDRANVPLSNGTWSRSALPVCRKCLRRLDALLLSCVRGMNAVDRAVDSRRASLEAA